MKQRGKYGCYQYLFSSPNIYLEWLAPETESMCSIHCQIAMVVRHVKSARSAFSDVLLLL